MSEHIVEDSPREDWEKKAIDRVKKDFERAETFMADFHQQYIDRYEHYHSGQKGENLKAKRNKFPVPFTREQVDTLVSRVMDKLFFKNRPCSIYGREETDRGDAEAKQELFTYQDQADCVESKVKKGLINGALSGIIPMQITYREEYNTRIAEVPVPVVGDDGVPLYDENGMPITVGRPERVSVPKYKGASVELISPLDYFVVPEKKTTDDQEAIIVRSMRRPSYFKGKSYFFNADKIRKREGVDDNVVDKHAEKRGKVGLDAGQDYYAQHCTYLEWQAWYEPEGEIESESGATFRPGFYVIGVVTGVGWEDVLVRFDGPTEDQPSPFPFDGSNTICGVLIEEEGEILGSRFVDTFHAIQHGMDTLLGVWAANLKQLVKRPKVVNAEALKWPDQINNDVDGVIEVDGRDDIDHVIKYPDVPPISQDVYAGLEMFRNMGQNASRLHDITEGRAQQGVETLGEAQILTAQSDTSINDYIKTIERTLIQPLYEKRNAINAAFLDQPYVFWVIGEKGLEWRTIEPSQIRANVDFICEASTREVQRGVIAQQILQLMAPASQLLQMFVSMGYPPQLWPRVDKLMAQLCEQWTWQSDKIEEIFPSSKLAEDEAQAFAPPIPAMPGVAGGGNSPQPRNEAEATASAQMRNKTQVGRT